MPSIRPPATPPEGAPAPLPQGPAVLLIVDEGSAEQRIDNFLLARLKGVPRSRIYRLLRTGEVRVNKGRVRPEYRLVSGDQVRIPPLRRGAEEEAPALGPQQLQRLREAILFEDAELLLIDKPAGMAVHGGSGLSHGMIEALRQIYPPPLALELVHRLDRDTSGCLLIAKRRSALRAVHELLRKGSVEKRYLALVSGRVDWAERRVDVPLRKNLLRGGEREVRVDPSGSPSVTLFRRVRAFPQATLVEARLLTGRTHQIRVHAAHLGHPILGDDKYGDPEANRTLRALGLRRLFLHASALSFPRGGGAEPFRGSSPLPEELERVLERLGAAG